MTGELRAELLLLLRTEPRVRRWLEREVTDRRARARLEADAARERERICPVCGDAFEPAHPEHVFDTGACKQKAYRERLRAARVQGLDSVQTPVAVAA